MISRRPHFPIRVALLTWLALLGSTTLAAQSGDLDYSAFSLDELFNIEVVTASKQEEPIWEAPGVVTVIHAAEIESFGANNLYELLGRAPGFANLFTFGVNRTSLRGGNSELASLHILLLIDGRPLRSSNGNYSINNAFFTYPLSMIEKIELVRGPGSVLYGTNAYEGVINIITKKNGAETIFTLAGGSFETESAELFTRQQVGEVALSVGARFFDTEGFPLDFSGYNLFTGDLVSYGDFDKGAFANDLGIHVSASYRGFTAQIYSGRDKQWSELFFDRSAGLSYHWQVYQYDLGYTHDFNAKWRLQTNVTNNREEHVFYLTNEITGESSVAIPTKTDDLLAEATIYGNLSPRSRILFGTIYQRLTGINRENQPFVQETFEFDDFSWSAYAQVDYKPSRYYKLIAGAQLNRPEGAETDIVPRVGAIVNFSPRLGMKVLYGEAYRSPTPFERGVRTSVQLGGNYDPNECHPMDEDCEEMPGRLEPEAVSTFDIQLFSKTETAELALTYFHSRETDLIDSEPFGDYTVGVYRNLDNEHDFQGIEIEAKIKPSRNWLFFGSYLNQSNELERNDGMLGSTLIPEYALKLGASYRTRDFTASLYNLTSDRFENIIEPTPDNERLLLNPPTNRFNIATLNLAWNLMGRTSFAKDLQIELYVTNLFDEEVWVPEVVSQVVNTIPGHGERAFYGKIVSRF